MKRQFLYFLFLIGSLGVCAQREFTVKRILKVDCPTSIYYLEKCYYAFMIPDSRPGRQEVLSYTYPSAKPGFMTRNEKNELFLNWKDISFGELKKSRLEVDIKIKISPYDLKTAKQNPQPDKKDMDTIPYLKDEENFRCESKSMKAAASGITGLGREEIVKNIFEFVGKSLDYKIFFFQDRGAKQALKDGQGDCTEYSELMITLCRAKKIPARIVMGLTMHGDGSVGHHNWVEVYFPEYGWVGFDPTWADGPNANTSFYKMKNCYVQLSNQRFTKTLFAPCQGKFPFSISMIDSCKNLSYDISEKYKMMLFYYNGFQPEKANALLDTLISYEPDSYAFWMYKAIVKARQGDFEKAFTCLQASSHNVVSLKQKKYYLYAAANYYALKNDADSAIITLKECARAGSTSYSQLEKDPDFEKIKDHPAFVALKKEWKEREMELKNEKKKQD